MGLFHLNSVGWLGPTPSEQAVASRDIADHVLKAFTKIQDATNSIAQNSSVSADIAKVGIYSISKAAANMLTKSAAVELAPFNIRVNAIAPGSIRTRLFDALFSHLPSEEAEKAIQDFGSNFPIKRVGIPDDIAGAMVFLTCDASSYMTGETIVIDGGCLPVNALSEAYTAGICPRSSG